MSLFPSSQRQYQPQTTIPSKEEQEKDLVEYHAAMHRLRYQSPDGTYTVADFMDERGQTFTARGVIIGIEPGDHAVIGGQWEQSSRYGWQLSVTYAQLHFPETPEGIIQFLATHIQGIGPKLATRIVDAFGIETSKVLDEEPEMLKKVSGIGKKKYAQIKDSWLANQSKRRIMIALQSYGISPAYAVRIIRVFAEESVHIVRHEPYRLAREVPGIGFKIADRIAQHVGFDLQSPERIQAGVEHTLHEAEKSQGHCFLTSNELLIRATKILEVEEKLIFEAISACAALHRIHLEKLPTGLTAIFRRGTWRTEVAITDHIERLFQATPLPSPKELQEAQIITLKLENLLGIKLAEEQRSAVKQGLTHPALVVTGGPGTGKTTLIRVLVAACDDLKINIVLAAPTGRAAKRLSQATGKEAKTLHRLLEFSFMAGGFQRNHDLPLENALYVIDESSMIDIYLMRALLSALPEGARIILVGDIDQLPSVGPGSVLADFIRCNLLPVIRLSHIFRQVASSLIIQNAHRINQGKLPRSPTREEAEESDYFSIWVRDPTLVEETIVGLVQKRLPAKYHLDPMTQIQVLCPMRVRAAGSDALNLRLQAALNPNGRPLNKVSMPIRIGDRVMQLRNNYEKNVYNGDVGSVAHWDNLTKKALVKFDENREVFYTYDELSDLTLAYACTVHKSQGSEYPAVIIPLVKHHFVLLQRNLIYTALTRARRLVIFVGDPKALEIAVNNAQPSIRNTRLSERLQALIQHS